MTTRTATYYATLIGADQPLGDVGPFDHAVEALAAAAASFGLTFEQSATHTEHPHHPVTADATATATATVERYTVQRYYADAKQPDKTWVIDSRDDLLDLEPPADWKPEYSSWRHGGWYVSNLRYASGAVGCVSRNYPDGKWRIVCDGRPFEEQPTFPTRIGAARAEYAYSRSLAVAQAALADTRAHLANIRAQVTNPAMIAQAERSVTFAARLLATHALASVNRQGER